MAKFIKHIGKMKNNSARVAIVFRTLPENANSALVVGTTGLTDAYHDSLMSLIESDSGQQANELGEILAVRRFPDGTVMLQYLHANGLLKKVPTDLVLMTPNAQTAQPLNEVNQMIAKERGVAIEDLAVTDGTKTKPTSKDKELISQESKITAPLEANTHFANEEISDPIVIAKQYRAKADKLSKDAANFLKMADAIDPPKIKVSAKSKKTIETAE